MDYMEPSLEYLAGFFDGEGSINIARFRQGTKEKLYLKLVCSVTNTYFPILPCFKERWDGGIAELKKEKSFHKDKWIWSVGSMKAEIFLRDVYPYLTVKKREAGIALAYRDYMSPHRGRNRGGAWYSEEHITKILDFKSKLEKGRTNRKNQRFLKVQNQEVQSPIS